MKVKFELNGILKHGILKHCQRAMFQALRSSHSPAPEWNSGLTERSPLKGTKNQFQDLQSVETDFAQLAPLPRHCEVPSNRGRGSAVDETPKIGLTAIGVISQLAKFKSELSQYRYFRISICWFGGIQIVRSVP